MTEQLGRVHALLAAGNVPCALRRRPDGDVVVAAATPTSGNWDVLLWEADGSLWIQHQGAVARLAVGGSDEAVANAVKLRVVRSWADQGNPEAKALLATIGDHHEPTTAGAGQRPGHYRPARGSAAGPVIRSVTAQFSPWGFGMQVTEREPGGAAPTSWAWQFGPGSVADYYRTFFDTWRSAVLGTVDGDRR